MTGSSEILDVVGDNIVISWGSKNPDNERICHDLGGEWHDFNAYRFHLTFDTARKLINTLGGFTYTKRAKKELSRMIKEHKNVISLSRAGSDAEVMPLLREEYPKTADALRSYQRAAIKFMCLNKSILLADHPGTGKTLATIATMVSAGVEGDILVLAPSVAVQATWPAEIRRWAPDDEVMCITGTSKKREEVFKTLRRKPKNKRRWILCNIEMARVEYHKPAIVDGKKKKGWYKPRWWQLFFRDEEQKHERVWAAIVIDESHRALVTKKTRVHEQTQQRAGISRLKTDGKRIAISGTPFRGKIENLWGTLNWLFPDQYTSFWKWVDQWFSKEENYFGGVEIGEVRKGQEEEFQSSLASFTLRRTKSEVFSELPPKTYVGTVPEGIDIIPGQEAGVVGHWLEMEPKQRRAYKEMEEEAIARLDEGSLVANGVLAEMTRLKQFASTYGKLVHAGFNSTDEEQFKFEPSLPSNKFEWLVSFLSELGIDGDPYTPNKETRKVVVASQFTSVIDVFDEGLKRLGIDTCKITGKVPQSKRAPQVEAFQRDDGPRVFLLNTIAGGVSLTLDRADDLVLLDETFIPDDQEQVEDRIHRVSRNHRVFIHYVRSLGTIEESIAMKTFERDSMQKKLLDGARGVSYARSILTA